MLKFCNVKFCCFGNNYNHNLTESCKLENSFKLANNVFFFLVYLIYLLVGGMITGEAISEEYSSLAGRGIMMFSY